MGYDEAAEAWEAYSYTFAAGWLILPAEDQDIFDAAFGHLEEEITVVRSRLGQTMRKQQPQIIRFDQLSQKALNEVRAILETAAQSFEPCDRFYSFQLAAEK